MDGYYYVWADTVCIDKSSSAELQEAIKSMWRWYRQARECYVFLADVVEPTQFECSRWWTRGWTLQELIAPQHVIFVTKDWTILGTRRSLSNVINSVTLIPIWALEQGLPNRSDFTIAERMSWASERQTTRVEDQAYSLMGLFDVNMPMLYGEGRKAFTRLQEEIIRRSSDQTIFAWEMMDGSVDFLSQSPDAFSALADLSNPSTGEYDVYHIKSSFIRRGTHSITNEGLNIELQLTPWSPLTYLALTNYQPKNLGFFIRKLDKQGRYVRVIDLTHGSVYPCLNKEKSVPMRFRLWQSDRPFRTERVTIVHSLDNPEERSHHNALYFHGYRLDNNYLAANVQVKAVDGVREWSPEHKFRTVLQFPPGGYGRIGSLSFPSKLKGHLDIPVSLMHLHFGFDFDGQPVFVVNRTHPDELESEEKAPFRLTDAENEKISTAETNEGLLIASRHLWMFKLNVPKEQTGSFLVNLRTVGDTDLSIRIMRSVCKWPWTISMRLVSREHRLEGKVVKVSAPYEVSCFGHPKEEPWNEALLEA